MSDLTYVVPPRLSGRQDLQNLLDNAYQQGREDKLKECKDALDKSVEMQTFWYEDGYQQGREDALKELSFSVHKDSTAMLNMNHYEYAIGVYDFDEKVKQMREQNNEKCM